MPSIVGIDLSDGIKILLGKDKAGVDVPPVWYNEANLTNYLASHTIAQTEDTVNKFLKEYFPSDQVMVHIFSTSPLKYTCIVADVGVVIPDNWWSPI
jgi:hypothetical protein